MNIGDKVKVVQDIDPGDCGIDPKYMGKIGTVTKIDLDENLGMLQVTFPDGSHDAFWPEELEAI